jgi:hypothetical protein
MRVARSTSRNSIAASVISGPETHLTDLLGNRVLYALAWSLVAEIRFGMLLKCYPVPVVRAESTRQLNARPACTA